MKRVSMSEAKANLSRYIEGLTPGEVIVLCNRNRPVAELRAIRRRKPRIGVAAGMFTIPPSFFDPLPEDMLRGFSGEND